MPLTYLSSQFLTTTIENIQDLIRKCDSWETVYKKIQKALFHWETHYARTSEDTVAFLKTLQTLFPHSVNHPAFSDILKTLATAYEEHFAYKPAIQLRRRAIDIDQWLYFSKAFSRKSDEYREAACVLATTHALLSSDYQAIGDSANATMHFIKAQHFLPNSLEFSSQCSSEDESNEIRSDSASSGAYSEDSAKRKTALPSLDNQIAQALIYKRFWLLDRLLDGEQLFTNPSLYLKLALIRTEECARFGLFGYAVESIEKALKVLKQRYWVNDHRIAVLLETLAYLLPQVKTAHLHQRIVALQEAFCIYQGYYGSNHLASRRVQSELQQLKQVNPEKTFPLDFPIHYPQVHSVEEAGVFFDFHHYFLDKLSHASHQGKKRVGEFLTLLRLLHQDCTPAVVATHIQKSQLIPNHILHFSLWAKHCPKPISCSDAKRGKFKYSTLQDRLRQLPSSQLKAHYQEYIGYLEGSIYYHEDDATPEDLRRYLAQELGLDGSDTLTWDSYFYCAQG